jgi:hypothetical protein
MKNLRILILLTFIGFLSTMANAQVKKLSPEQKRIQDSTKKVQDSIKKAEVSMKRMEAQNKTKAQRESAINARKAAMELKRVADSTKKAEMAAKKNPELLREKKALADSLDAVEGKAKGPAAKGKPNANTNSKAGNKPANNVAKKPMTPEERRIQDSIKKADLANKRMQSKTGMDAKKQAALDKKEAMEQMKMAKAGGQVPVTVDKKTQDSIKRAEAKDKRLIATGKKKPNEAPKSAASNDQQTDKLYFSMPKDALLLIKDYLEETEENDDKDFRRSFIAREPNNPANPQFLKLKRGNDKKYSALQYFTSGAKGYMAIEYTNCSGECNNSLKFWQNDNGTWSDVTTTLMPAINKKDILSRIKSKYKEDYKDLDLYNAKGYETSDDIYNKAIMFIITREGTIQLKDQYIDFPVAELVWDVKSGKFDVEKAKSPKTPKKK